MTSKEALELAILEYEKDLEFDENNQWVKNVLKGLKECQQDLDQLEKHRKIEEEIGIDFITLFKALKNGFYHIDKNKHIYTTKPTKGNGGSMNFYTCLECIIAEDTYGDQYIYSLKDYGKVWALTKEELDQNE